MSTEREAPEAARLQPEPPIVRFGIFEANFATEELRKGGVLIHLPGQPFRILAQLIEHPGEIVTREQLRHGLWPEDTYVDFDRCLNTAVNRLREALNDSAEHPRYIQTLPRRGYRFLAPVERLGRPFGNGEPEDLESQAVAEPAVARTTRLRRWPLIAAVVAALAVAAIAWFRFETTSLPSGPPVSVALTSFPGSEITPSYSPDGTAVAFSWNGENRDNYDIYVQAVGSRTPLRLTNSPAEDFAPSYSPDGRRIAFYRRSGDSVAIYVISSQGDTALRSGLSVGPSGPSSAITPRRSAPGAETLSWSPDGKFLAYVDKGSPQDPYSIFVISVENRRQEQLTWPPPDLLGDGSPRFSPDGRMLAFVRKQTGLSGDIYLASLAGGAPQRLTTDGRRISGLTWTQDGRSMLFASDRTGEDLQLWRVPVLGGVPERLAQVRERAGSPTVPVRGHGLAFVRWARQAQIWRLPLAPIGPAAAAKLDLAGEVANPQFSPDGSRIAWSSQRAGVTEIWVSDSSGLNPVRLTWVGGKSASPRWSPDGQEIAFDSFVRGSWDIYVIGARGGRPQPLTTHPGEDVRPSWSSDGRWVYFGSDRSGTMQIWKARRGGGDARQVTRHGGYEAVESRDGSFVYYVRRGVAGLWRTPVEGGQEELVLKSLQWENSRNWVVTPKGVYFLAWEGSRPSERKYSLQLLRLDTGRVEQVASLGDGRVLDHGCSISPDGKWLLYVQDGENETDIAVLRDFR